MAYMRMLSGSGTVMLVRVNLLLRGPLACALLRELTLGRFILWAPAILAGDVMRVAHHIREWSIPGAGRSSPRVSRSHARRQSLIGGTAGLFSAAPDRH